MSRINSIGFNIVNGNANLYTRRTCSDNSELFIASKLNMLYKQAMSNGKQFNSKRNLRKLVEGHKLDEII